jgi:cellulose synthase/poly-beta-1,6-N-acetylglucosamine synthase-like glycosyltransferase
MNEWVALLAACAVAYTAHAAALTRACLRAQRSVASTGEQPTVSVIVCIKDDAEHWPAWWAAVKGQQWPAGTEVIAIDDGSTDELPALLTRAVQEEVSFTFAHYRIDETSPGKRDALRFGVGQASGEWLLFTDVDCLPAGPAWASEMTAGHPGDVAAVLGGSWPKDEAPATWLSRVQALDALYIMRSYVGWAERDKPYMGVGRNLAIRRSAFPGFTKAPATASGDDDMVIQAIASAPDVSVAVAAHRAAHMDTAMPATWSDWLAQKRRHWTTVPHYKAADQWRLAVPKALRTGALLAAVLAVVVHNSLWITGALLGGMWLGELFNFRSITKAYQAPYSWRNRGGLLSIWLTWSAWVALSLMWKRQDKRQW